MQYRNFGKTGISLSALGFGCMRLPLLPDGSGVDEAEAIRMIRAGIDGGINYVDTAWGYHSGVSELIVAKALKDGYREKVFLATKNPVWLVKEPEDFDKLLDKQLEKLSTDYIDFYLLHALDGDRWSEVQRLEVLKRADAAKAAGKIRHIGFSFHDDFDVFQRILDGYDWDFCQIQMNYVDLEHQAGIKGVREAGRRNLGLVIMEPLLGGKLTNLKEPTKKVLSDKKADAEWGLDFLWNLPEVGVVLSGMSTMKQVEDNLVYAGRSAVGMLGDADIEMLSRVRAAYLNAILAPCTVCEYCLPCPAGIAIPQALESYNQTATLDLERAGKHYRQFVEVGAASCLHCAQCESKCPQHLPVSDLMYKIEKVFGR